MRVSRILAGKSMILLALDVTDDGHIYWEYESSAKRNRSGQANVIKCVASSAILRSVTWDVIFSATVYNENMTNDKEQDTRSLEEIIQEQRILDNIMVPVFFESDSPEAKAALQEILRVLLGDPELIVEKYHAEHVMSNTGHHGVRIDVWARVGKDRQLALELQKVTDTEVYPRALFEAATMIVHSLPPGDSYDDIDDVVVIFFTQRDLESEGKSLYTYKVMRTDVPEIEMPKSPTYIFVNGQYQDNRTELGRVIADVMEPDPAHMHSPILRERMYMLKNTAEGRARMGDALKNYAERYAEDKTRQILFTLVRNGDLQAAKAAQQLGMTEEQFEALMQIPISSIPT